MHFVGINTDETRSNMNGKPMQIASFPGLAFTAQSVTHERCDMGEKLWRSARLHFDQQGLAFVYGHVGGRTDRLELPVAPPIPITALNENGQPSTLPGRQVPSLERVNAHGFCELACTLHEHLMH